MYFDEWWTIFFIGHYILTDLFDFGQFGLLYNSNICADWIQCRFLLRVGEFRLHCSYFETLSANTSILVTQYKLRVPGKPFGCIFKMHLKPQVSMWRARLKGNGASVRTRSMLCLQDNITCPQTQCNTVLVSVFTSHRSIFALGVSMTFLNVPVEWISLGCEWTWMLLFEDVQQGVFYSSLFCFWIIFCGEHLMVRTFCWSVFLTVLFILSCKIFFSFYLNNKSLRTTARGIVSRRTGGRSGSWCSAHLFSSYLTWVKGNDAAAFEVIFVLLFCPSFIIYVLYFS